MFHNKTRFYGAEFLSPRPTPKLEDHPLSAVRDYLFNIFAAPLHAGGHSSICNLRTHHAVVRGTHLSWYLGLNVHKTCSPIKSASREHCFIFAWG